MKNTILISVLMLLFASCSKELLPKKINNPSEVYEEFWNHVNENYIYFDEKNVDWDSVYQVHSIGVNDNTSDEELLQAMEQSMLTLRDGHNTIKTPFRRAQGYNYTQGYEVHFSLDLVEEKYIDGNLSTERIFRYGNVNDKTVYIHVPDMDYIVSLRKLIRQLITDQTKNLIIDLRNNGGGDSDPVPGLLGDFVDEKTLLGSYIEKSGPNREDETAPIPIYTSPNEDFNFDVKVFLLINRKGYSATSYMAAMCKDLPNFTLVGQKTGGGGGGNAGYELSNGWKVMVSVSDFIDKDGNTIETGVTPNVMIENSEQDILNSNDIMLEKVIELTDQ